MARIWEQLQQGARPIRRLRRLGVRFTEDKTEPDREDASSYAYQQHEVFSIGYNVRCSYDDALSSYQFHRDKDCSVVRATTERFDISREKYCIRQRAHGNVVERSMGGIP